MPYDVKDANGNVVATFQNPPTQQDLEDLDTHLSSSATQTAAPATGAYAPDPEAPSMVNGLKSKTMEMVKHAMPWLAGDLGKPADKSVIPAEEPPLGLSTDLSLASGGTQRQPNELAPSNPPAWPTDASIAFARMSKDEQNKYLGQELSRFGNEFVQTMPISAGPGAVDKTFPILKDILTRKMPNAAKWVAGKVGNAGQIPQRIAAKYLHVPMTSDAVETKLANKISVTGGKTIEEARNLMDKVWEPHTAAIAEATEKGVKLPYKDIAIKAANDELLEIAERFGQESPEYKKAAREIVRRFENAPTELPIESVELRKQGLNKLVNNWESSASRDEAKMPQVAIQKAVKRALNPAIGEATASPEAVAQANKEYSELSKLFKKADRQAEKYPAWWAEEEAARRPFRSATVDKALEKIGDWFLYPMQKAGRNIKPKPPQGGGPYNPLDDIMSGGGGGGAPPATPGSAADGWQRSVGGEVRDDFGNLIQGDRQVKVHPDWFDGLEPSEAALKAREGQLPSQQVPDKFQAAPAELDDIFAQQMRPNVPEVEPTPGTLIEGDVPRGSFSQPEGWGSIPEQPSFVHELGPNRPPNVMPDTETYPGTLMEGEVPAVGFQKAKGAKSGRKGR